MSKTTPQIYIANLNAYNNGRLVGEWCDADCALEIEETVNKVLAAGGGEEVAVHDYEGMPSLGEHPAWDTVYAVAEGMMEFGEAFEAYVESQLGDVDWEVKDQFQNQFRGTYSRESGMSAVAVFGYDSYHETHGSPPPELDGHIDWDSYGNSELQGYTYLGCEDREIHVFHW